MVQTFVGVVAKVDWLTACPSAWLSLSIITPPPLLPLRLAAAAAPHPPPQPLSSESLGDSTACLARHRLTRRCRRRYLLPKQISLILLTQPTESHHVPPRAFACLHDRDGSSTGSAHQVLQPLGRVQGRDVLAVCFPVHLPISPHRPHILSSSTRYLIPFWLVAILLIVVAVCCKMMYAM